MARGFFITLEGGEGAGKSTHAAGLARALGADGREVVLTREPGGSPESEAIRELLVGGAVGRWSPCAEALLFAAAREEHLRQTIRPALGRGAIVVCDRFTDSTRAYQGAGGGVDPGLLDILEASVVGGTRPDLTLILDLDPGAGLARSSARGQGSDRFERREPAFHERLRAAFLAIAAAEPERCVVIDASRGEADIAAEITDIARRRIGAGAGER